ncbi:MAG TPA: nicotinate-nucleotide adenylyltransferase [Spirochaetota bacterium]|nr:nicotinate-nucleotide adenylyltransferase [Spirochaetota bacterium]HOL57036.1 nicotinate-nucleotide adenylyltransferase [Spirochaetota bacterium]HPP04634.1 nicotinate-nucleotide adenylyltransferase [Spirochaetota bacterium]
MKITKEIFKNKKIALYGGTFNPIHLGHLLTAIYVRENLGYDLVIFIPANIPVHKDTSCLIDPKKRLKMVELSIRNIKYFLLSDIEIKRGGNSYTIDTVLELKEKYEYNDKFGIIIGDDLLPDLDKWKNIDLLQNICNIICFKRDKYIDIKTNYKVEFVNNRIIEISSTEIRDRIKKGLSIDFMVTDKVKKYIQKNRLYL